MNEKTVSLIISLLPIAEKLIFEVGGKLIELNVSKVNSEDVVKAIEESKSASWPKLTFSGPKPAA